MKVQDPNTVAGQKKGAILQIKHQPVKLPSFRNTVDYHIRDCIKIIKHKQVRYSSNGKDEKHDVTEVLNMRHGGRGDMLWIAVFPVGVGKVCACDPSRQNECHCEYVDFEASMVSDLSS